MIIGKNEELPYAKCFKCGKITTDFVWSRYWHKLLEMRFQIRCLLVCRTCCNYYRNEHSCEYCAEQFEKLKHNL